MSLNNFWFAGFFFYVSTIAFIFVSVHVHLLRVLNRE